MPLYEYMCTACGERFEKLVRNSNQPEAVQCPGCANTAVERVISLFATSGKPDSSSAATPACGPVG